MSDLDREVPIPEVEIVVEDHKGHDHFEIDPNNLTTYNGFLLNWQ